MTNFDVTHGATVSADAFNEIRPQQCDVLVIRLVQMRIKVHIRLFISVGIKRAAIGPAHMKSAMIAVKVATHVGFLGPVSGIEAVLPVGRKGLKLKRHYLRVRRVRRVAPDPASGHPNRPVARWHIPETGGSLWDESPG